MAVVKLKDPQGAKVRTITSESENGIKCKITTPEGGHQFYTDEPAERGGTGTAAAPLFYFTSSLAACQTVQIHKAAAAMRLKHGAINIECSTTTDRIPPIDGGNDKVMRFCAAEMHVEIETNEPKEKIERLMKISEDMCPVGNLFSDAGYPPVLTFTIKPMPSND